MRKVTKASPKDKKTKLNSQGFKYLKGGKAKEESPEKGPFRKDRTKMSKRKPIKRDR